MTETIRVQAEGMRSAAASSAIFRRCTPRPDGSRVEVRFDVISVTATAGRRTTHTEGFPNGVRSKSATQTFALAGQHNYVIRYRTTRQIGFFEEFDELYWNATGNGWPFDIENAEARIKLPGRVQLSRTRSTPGRRAQTGRRAGGRGAGRAHRVADDAAAAAWKGVTVAAAWEKGIVEPPSADGADKRFLADNLALPVWSWASGVAFFYFDLAALGAIRPGARSFRCSLRQKGISPAAARFLDR